MFTQQLLSTDNLIVDSWYEHLEVQLMHELQQNLFTYYFIFTNLDDGRAGFRNTIVSVGIK